MSSEQKEGPEKSVASDGASRKSSTKLLIALLDLAIWLVVVPSAVFCVWLMFVTGSHFVSTIQGPDRGQCLKSELRQQTTMQMVGEVFLPATVQRNVCIQWEYPEGKAAGQQ